MHIKLLVEIPVNHVARRPQSHVNFNGTLNSWWTKIVIGVLLLIFIVLQKLISRRAVAQL